MERLVHSSDWESCRVFSLNDPGTRSLFENVDIVAHRDGAPRERLPMPEKGGFSLEMEETVKALIAAYPPSGDPDVPKKRPRHGIFKKLEKERPSN